MKKTPAKDQVLEVIGKNPGCDTKTITEKVDYGVDTVRKVCKALVDEGKITKEEVKNGSLKKFIFNNKSVKMSRSEMVKKAKTAAIVTSEARNEKLPKNREKVSFQGEEYGKAKLVRAIVIAFVAANPKMSFEKLAAKLNFDKNGRRVYPKYDVIRATSDDLVKKSINGKYKRYYTNQLQKSADGVEFAICREWGLDNVDKDFIDAIAKDQLNYKVDNFTK